MSIKIDHRYLNTYVGNAGNNGIKSVKRLEICRADGVQMDDSSGCSSNCMHGGFRLTKNRVDIGHVLYCALDIVADGLSGYLADSSMSVCVAWSDK